MTGQDEQITISKKALREALLELEQQHSREYYHLFDCLKQMEQAYLSLYRLMDGCYSMKAKAALVELVFPKASDFAVSDELFYQWRADFKAHLQAEKAQAKQEGVTLLVQKRSPSQHCE